MSDPYAPPSGPGWGQPYVPPPPRPWYRAPGSVVGAAVFSATASWITVALIAVGFLVLPRLHPDTFEEWVFFILFGLLAIALLFAAGFVAFWLAVAGAIATVPLAIAWWRGGERTPAAIAALSTAVVSWIVLAYLVVDLGLVRAVF